MDWGLGYAIASLCRHWGTELGIHVTHNLFLGPGDGSYKRISQAGTVHVQYMKCKIIQTLVIKKQYLWMCTTYICTTCASYSVKILYSTWFNSKYKTGSCRVSQLVKVQLTNWGLGLGLELFPSLGLKMESTMYFSPKMTTISWYSRSLYSNTVASAAYFSFCL